MPPARLPTQGPSLPHHALQGCKARWGCGGQRDVSRTPPPLDDRLRGRRWFWKKNKHALGEGGSRGSRCWQARHGVWRRSGQAGGWLGWRVAPRVPYGARPGPGGPPGSSGWAGQGTWAEKVPLAGCHHAGVLLHPRLTLHTILGLPAPLAGGAQPRTPGVSPLLSTSLHFCPCLWSSPWLPSGTLYAFVQPVTRDLLGCPRPHSRLWSGCSGISQQTHRSLAFNGSLLPSGQGNPPSMHSKLSTGP